MTQDATNFDAEAGEALMDDELAEELRRVAHLSSDHRLIEESFQQRTPVVHPERLEGTVSAFYFSEDDFAQVGFTLLQPVADKPSTQCTSVAVRDSTSSTGWRYESLPPSTGIPFLDPELQCSFMSGGKQYLVKLVGGVKGLLRRLVFRSRARDSSGLWTVWSDYFQWENNTNTLLNSNFCRDLKLGHTTAGYPYLSGVFHNQPSERIADGKNAILYLHPKTGAWVFKWVETPGVTFCAIPMDFADVEITEESVSATILYLHPTGGEVRGRIQGLHSSEKFSNTDSKTTSYKTPYGLASRVVLLGARTRELNGEPDFFSFVPGTEVKEGILRYHHRLPNDVYGVIELTGEDGMPAKLTQAHYTEVDGAACLVALDGDHSLWILRPTGWGNHGFTGLTWSKLGDRFKTVTVTPKQTSGLEFFGVNQKNEAVHVYQAPDSTWFFDLIQDPEPKPTKDTLRTRSAYVVELTCTTAHDVPLAGVAVHVAANRYTEIVSDGVSHYIGPKTRVVLESDMRGKVRFSVEAHGLTAPTFKVRVDSLMGEHGHALAIRPDVHAFEKLRDIDERQLDGLVDERYEKDKKDIASALQEASKLALKKSDAEQMDDAAVMDQLPSWKRKTPYLKGLELFDYADHDQYQCKPDHDQPMDWSLTFGGDDSASGGVKFVDKTGLQDEEEPLATSFIVEEIGNFFRWAHNVISDVVEFGCKVAGAVLEFSIKIAETLYRGAMSTIQQIGSFIELIFEKIATVAAEAIGKVLDWLKEVFGWTDILRTQRVFKHLVTETFRVTEGLIEDAENWIKQGFESAKDVINRSLDSAIKNLEGESIQGLVRGVKGQPAIGDNPLVPGALGRSFRSIQVQASYVNSKADKLVTEDRDWAIPEELDSLAANLGSSLKRLGTEFRSAFTNIWNAVKNLLGNLASYRDPLQLLKGVLRDLLELIKAVVVGALDVVKQVLVIFLKLIRALLEHFQEVLKQPVSIPVLSELYLTMTGSPLTLLNLGTLMSAVPVTLAYKAVKMGDLIRGDAAPFSEARTRAFEQSELPFQSPFKKHDAVVVESALTTDLSWIYKVGLPMLSSLAMVPKAFYFDPLASAISRASNDLPPAPPTPLEIGLSVPGFLNDLLIHIAGAPFTMWGKPGHPTQADIWTTRAFVADLVRYLLPVGFVVTKVPFTSDLQGISGMLGGVPHFVAATAKIVEKEPALSVCESVLSAVTGWLPLTIRDGKTDSYFGAFFIGQGLTMASTLGGLGLRIAGVVETARSHSLLSEVE